MCIEFYMQLFNILVVKMYLGCMIFCCCLLAISVSKKKNIHIHIDTGKNKGILFDLQPGST